MPADASSYVPVEVLRKAVRERVADTSIRSAAGETGMSVTGLWRFLGGTDPYLKTRRRLQHWYVQHHARQPASELPLEVAQAAIALLTQHIDPAARPAYVRRLLAVIGAVDGDAPSWLQAIEDTAKTRPRRPRRAE